MEQKTILVTGIGGNVGQGILRNLKFTNYKLQLIGCDIAANTVADFLCAQHYKVPYAFDENYIDTIIDICNKHHVDLIIPSTDYETLYLSKNKQKLPLVACSTYSTCENFVDKYLTYLLFQQYDIPFAKSYLPSQYNGEFDKSIAKPRKGRGSRGIIINPIHWNKYSDDEYMIQELAEGTEITTAFYVNKNNELHSFISFERKLENGTTVFCKTTNHLDNELDKLINKIIKSIPIQGSCNIQFIYTNQKEIIPFEINGRISGTNSIRSQFGFEDVKWTVDELLYNKTLEKPILKKGIATRMLMDIIFEDENITYDKINAQSNYSIF